MAEQNVAAEAEAESKRAKFGQYLKKGWDMGLARGKDEALRGKAALEKAAGLGPRPNAVPPMEADIKSPPRQIELGWHPVAGFSGKWFAEKTRIGQYISKEIGKYPDPTQHWAVLVGNYAHQLWMDENLNIIYTNETINRNEWRTFTVGHTTFNDEALRQTGEMVIHNMRNTRPGYNLISNNCQNFAVNMLDAIQLGAHREFATTFAIYQRATGHGRIKDLFTEPSAEQQQLQDPHMTHDASVQLAQQVMNENTTQVDDHTQHGLNTHLFHANTFPTPPNQPYYQSQQFPDQQYQSQQFPNQQYPSQQFPNHQSPSQQYQTQRQ